MGRGGPVCELQGTVPARYREKNRARTACKAPAPGEVVSEHPLLGADSASLRVLRGLW